MPSPSRRRWPELIDRADPNDPIARQFVPDAAELDTRPEERADPIGDDAHSPVPGIVHRYPDRVLLKLTHVCAVYCRFCFRREMVGPGTEPLTAKQLDAAIDYIASRPDIWEVILTGGDPLVLSPRRIKERDVAACVHRPCQGRPRPHPRAGCRAFAHHQRNGARAQGQRQSHLRRAARQPRPRADRRRARGLRAHHRRRHPDAQPVGAAQGRQRRSADTRRAAAHAGRDTASSPTTCTTAISRPARRISAPRSNTDRS